MPNSTPERFTPADAARLVALEARYRRALGRRLDGDIVQAAVAAGLRLDQHVAETAPTRHAVELRRVLDGMRHAGLGMVHEVRSAADHDGYARLAEAWARAVGLALTIRSARTGPWPDGVAAETAAWWTTAELLTAVAPARARVGLFERRGATTCVILADGCGRAGYTPTGFELCRMLGARVMVRRREPRLTTAIAFPAAR
jgi:hypothetical protein